MAQNPGRTCPNCGSPVAADQRFCTNCGAVLEAPPPSQYGGQEPRYPQGQQLPPYAQPQQQVPPYAQQQQQVPPYAQQPQQQQSPFAEAFAALGLLFLLRRFGRGYSGYVPRRQSSGCCGCLVLLVIFLVVFGIPGFFVARSRIPALKNYYNSVSSGNSGGLTTQPPIKTVQINQTVHYAGVAITIVSAEQSQAFLDDSNSSTNGMLRLNIKESNTSTAGARYFYDQAFRLILPDKSSVAPVSEAQLSGPDAGVTRTNWLDFQVPTSDQVGQLSLQLGSDTEAQELIPLTGKADLRQYQPKTVHPNVSTQYAGLTWTITSATVTLSFKGQQASKGMEYVTLTLKVDNPTSRDVTAYYGDYIRLKAGGTTSAPTGDTTLALDFPAGSSGTTGDVIFVMPTGSSSYTLMLLDTPSTQYAQASANFQVG